MKIKSVVILLLMSCFFISCKDEENIKKSNTENTKSPKEKSSVVETISEKNTDIENIRNSNRPKKSEIITSKFDLNLLFGIWTYDPNGPHADFVLSKESFYVADYDGDGDMPYVLNHDTIRVYYNDYVRVGIIKSVTKDTLKINWDENGIVNCVKWKG